MRLLSVRLLSVRLLCVKLLSVRLLSGRLPYTVTDLTMGQNRFPFKCNRVIYISLCIYTLIGLNHAYVIIIRHISNANIMNIST